MSKPSGATIDERVRRFAESVRNGMFGFKPGESWWIVKHTSESRVDEYYSSAGTFCEQLGISEEDMGKHLKNSRWNGQLGGTFYVNYFRQGKVKKISLVTVTMENQTNNSSPTDEDSKVISRDVDTRLTRSSVKAPWEILQESICGINSTTATSPSKKRKRSNSKKKKNKIINLSTQSIDNLFLYNSTSNLKTTGVSSSETVVPKTTLLKLTTSSPLKLEYYLSLRIKNRFLFADLWLQNEK